MTRSTVQLLTPGVRQAHAHEFRRTAKRTSAGSAAILRERARIARDLHDTVSQTLYAISLTASRALSLLEQDQALDVQHVIDNVLRLANSGQTELRALLIDMRSGASASAGLTKTLETLVVDMATRSGLDIRLSLGNERQADLPAAAQDGLLMICREALHNAIRHSKADRIDIVLEVGSGAIVLLIADNGRGFDPAKPRPGHFGLQSMHERTAAIGATLQLASADGAGTQVRVCLPRVAQRNVGNPRARSA
jgi:signal transduction histidine kinase